MKFRENNVIEIAAPDTKVKVFCYVIGTLIGLGFIGLSLYLAVVNNGTAVAPLKALGSVAGGIILFAICGHAGEHFYRDLPTHTDVKIPLSQHIAVRKEGSYLALYYKRWGSYRRWGTKHIESFEEGALNEEVAQYKNEYRLAYTSRREKHPKADANRILYEGKL